MSKSTFMNILDLLEQGNAQYKVLEHAPEGRCADVSKLRGNKIAEANKALVVRTKGPKGKEYFLLALRADHNSDFDKLGNYRDVRLCNPEKVKLLTDCVIGSVPPFSFHPDLKIVVDPLLLKNDSFWFNAGLLDKSICLRTKDYIRLVKPEIKDISSEKQIKGFY